MRRKLVKHGETTLMTSLPAKWLRENNAKKGDDINIEEKDNRLVISLESEKSKKQTEIKLTNLTESSIRTLLTNLYRLGYEKLIINFPNKNALKIIEETVKNNLIGFEIIKINPNNCLIEDITEPSPEQFDNIFSKVLLNIDSLFEIIEDFLNNKKPEFESTEKQILAFDNFCRRVISNNNSAKDHLKWAFHAELMHAQRELYLGIRHLSKNKITSKNEISDLLKHCEKIYELLKQAYKTKNLETLEKIHELEKDLIYNKGYNQIKKSKDPIVIHHLMNAIRFFYLASSPLFGLFAKE